jgi:N-acetylmuramoyl-L-alanine amidase
MMLVSAGIALIVAASVGMFLGERIATGLGLLKTAGAPPLASAVSTRSVGQSADSVGQVEVPDLTGMGLIAARVLAEAAGLAVEVHVDAALMPSVEQRVHSQSQAAGSVVSVGTRVVLEVPRLEATKAKSASKSRLKRTFVVALDPGHQSEADSALEPIGPGASANVARATVGGIGVATRVPEYELTRQIAAELEDRLVAEKAKVVVTRTTNDVNISEAERAEIANNAKADLLVEIHLRSGDDSEAVGVSTMYPAPNQWTSTRVSSSRKAAEIIQRNVVASTDAASRGAMGVDGVTGFNWSKAPCVLVEVGCLSNPMEDRLVASARYQDLVVEGMADGIIEYLAGGQ